MMVLNRATLRRAVKAGRKDLEMSAREWIEAATEARIGHESDGRELPGFDREPEENGRGLASVGHGQGCDGRQWLPDVREN